MYYFACDKTFSIYRQGEQKDKKHIYMSGVVRTHKHTHIKAEQLHDTAQIFIIPDVF